VNILIADIGTPTRSTSIRFECQMVFITSYSGLFILSCYCFCGVYV